MVHDSASRPATVGCGRSDALVILPIGRWGGVPNSVSRFRWLWGRQSMAEAGDVELDVIAVGAHPDDVEIACGGTLARLVRKGYQVGIVDLTDGEPTPLSPGPDVRLAEAQRAAEILGVAVRINLNLPNRRLFDSFEA